MRTNDYSKSQPTSNVPPISRTNSTKNMKEVIKLLTLIVFFVVAAISTIYFAENNQNYLMIISTIIAVFIYTKIVDTLMP